MFWRRRQPVAYTDGVIDLVRLWLQEPDPALRFGRVVDYSIRPHGSRREAGRLSLRFGESPALYYFGHIGYHVDPPWRGHHYARRACALVAKELLEGGLRTAVITCDPDNWPSRKTCEGLSAVLERQVAVPQGLQQRWDISPEKCRYIWHMDAFASRQKTG